MLEPAAADVPLLAQLQLGQTALLAGPLNHPALLLDTAVADVALFAQLKLGQTAALTDAPETLSKGKNCFFRGFPNEAHADSSSR